MCVASPTKRNRMTKRKNVSTFRAMIICYLYNIYSGLAYYSGVIYFFYLHMSFGELVAVTLTTVINYDVDMHVSYIFDISWPAKITLAFITSDSFFDFIGLVR